MCLFSYDGSVYLVVFYATFSSESRSLILNDLDRSIIAISGEAMESDFLSANFFTFVFIFKRRRSQK